MGILEDLSRDETWREFLCNRIEKAHLSKKDALFLTAFIENRDYLPVVTQMQDPGYVFPPPQKKLLNKQGKRKKRVIYLFPPAENTVLKLISYLLYRYDDRQPANCYSFRRHFGPKRAIAALVGAAGIGEKYACKIDIKDYFNSIDVDLLMPILHDVLSDDPALIALFEKLLRADTALFAGERITEKRGAMAGTPVSQFFANLYLIEMDQLFAHRGILYARYSDDIIFFADSAEQLQSHIAVLRGFLERYRLEINPDKTRITGPGEPWDYLGISYRAGRVGLSEGTMQKIKGKIRRKARAIYRWKIKKGVDTDKAIAVFAREMQKKFFGRGNDDDFTWTRWFFSLITTDEDLVEIDRYLQENMRYLSSGRHNRANYRVRYADLKACGYRSLVNAYHRYRKNGETAW